MERDAFLQELTAAEICRVVPFTRGAALPANAVLVGRSGSGAVPPGAIVLTKPPGTSSVARLASELPDAVL